MALDDDIRILSAVGLFSELTGEQLRLLAFGAETQRFAAGREIYREGAVADSAYIVVRGTVVLATAAHGMLEEVARFGPGAILGEMALIAESSRLTFALAETDIEVLRLSRTLFRRILEEYPDVAVKLHRRISSDLETMIRRIERLGPRFAG